MSAIGGFVTFKHADALLKHPVENYDKVDQCTGDA